MVPSYNIHILLLLELHLQKPIAKQNTVLTVDVKNFLQVTVKYLQHQHKHEVQCNMLHNPIL